MSTMINAGGRAGLVRVLGVVVVLMTILDIAAVQFVRSTPTVTGPIITVEQARAVFEDFWPRRERAITRFDVAATKLLESGIALEADNAVNKELHGTEPLPPRSFSRLDLFVPRQHAYPAHFLAEAQAVTRDTPEGSDEPLPLVKLMVFTRQERRSAWKLAYEAGYVGSEFQMPAIGADGYMVNPPTPGWVNTDTVQQEFAAYWQHWKNAGGAPSETRFVPGPWTTERGQEIAEVPQGGVSPLCNCLHYAEYQADTNTDPVYRFAVRVNSGAPPLQLACGTLRVRGDSKALPHRELVQPESLTNWGSQLPPGLYSKISTFSFRNVCILIGATPGEGLVVLSALGHRLDVTGVRSGAVVATATYDAYGKPTTTTGNVNAHSASPAGTDTKVT